MDPSRILIIGPKRVSFCTRSYVLYKTGTDLFNPRHTSLFLEEIKTVLLLTGPTWGKDFIPMSAGDSGGGATDLFDG